MRRQEVQDGCADGCWRMVSAERALGVAKEDHAEDVLSRLRLYAPDCHSNFVLYCLNVMAALAAAAGSFLDSSV